MATVREIYDYIDKIAPFNMQEEYDNSGMLVGNINAQVSTVAVALDITTESIEEAKRHGAELIVSHHPVIFEAQKSFKKGNLAYELARNGINVISAHTSYDVADNGVNDVLCEILGLKNVQPFPTVGLQKAMVRSGEIDEVSSEKFSEDVGIKLETTVRYCKGRNIKKVAVCGGAGGCFLDEVIEAGFDAYVTGDIKHHEILKAREAGITLVAAGHYETENPSMKPLADKLEKAFEDITVICIKTENPILFK